MSRKSGQTAKPPSQPTASYWPRFELWAALALTLWIIALHLTYLFRAGPLWRDEIGTIDFAAMPSVGDIWHNLQYDNFPPLFVFVARFWMALGLTSDFNLRLLGFLIGLITLGIIWFTTRILGARAPLLALALYAASPLAIRIGDALRPYGLGIACTILTLGLIWKFIQEPKTKHLIFAAVAAVLSVQCLYQCAFFLVAFSIGAWLVTLARKQRKVAFQTGLIGVIAALSLLPHLGNIRKGNEWLVVAHVPVDLAGLWRVLGESLSAGGGWMQYGWIALFFIALVEAFFFAVRKKNWNLIYCGCVLLTATVAHLAFLRILSLPLRSWYFLIMLAVAAMAMDVILSGLHFKKLQAPLALILTVLSISKCFAGVQLRHTNLDLVAAKLKQSVQTGDLVLVSPWYYGVAFQRYYGTNGFTTIPPMTELRIHRYDLMRDVMDSPDPMAPVKTEIERTLRGGHKLWVTGVFQFLQPGQAAMLLPERRPAQGGDALYFSTWMFQLTSMVAAHATKTDLIPIPVPDNQPVDVVENLTVQTFQGWHD